MRKNVYILEDRAILFISGVDSKNFLQNLISNDINKVTEESSCFASLLTPQGKFLFEFIIVKHKSGYFIDCEKSQCEEIFKQLNLYKIRSKIEILNLSNEFVVACFDYDKYLSIEGAKDILDFTFKYREDPIILDPRNKKLGARLIINLEKLYLTLKKLDLNSDKIDNYYSKSHKLGIVPKDLNKLQNNLFGIECNYEELNGIDFKKGCYVGQENTARIKLKNKLFGIECNFEELNGIDFKKGCYVGQENTARIKLKNKISKRLLPIEIVDGKLYEDESIFYN